MLSAVQSLLLKYLLPAAGVLVVSLFTLLKIRNKKIAQLQSQVGVQTANQETATLDATLASAEDEVAKAKEAYDKALSDIPDGK